MNEIIKEYGGGLYALAAEEHLEEHFMGQIRLLRDLLPADYIRLLIHPAIPKEERVALVSGALDGRVHPHLASFVKLMTERNLATEIVSCFGEFERLYYDAFGIVRIRAQSAVPLNDGQKKKLEDKLTASTGHRVEVTYEVNPSLLGGLRLLFDNRQMDDSIRTRLREIRDRLAGVVL